jgi:hypothetical protein
MRAESEAMNGGPQDWIVGYFPWSLEKRSPGTDDRRKVTDSDHHFSHTAGPVRVLRLLAMRHALLPWRHVLDQER